MTIAHGEQHMYRSYVDYCVTVYIDNYFLTINNILMYLLCILCDVQLIPMLKSKIIHKGYGCTNEE